MAQTLEGQPAGTIFRLLNETLGQNIKLGIRRGGEERELDDRQVRRARQPSWGAPFSQPIRGTAWSESAGKT